MATAAEIQERRDKLLGLLVQIARQPGILAMADLEIRQDIQDLYEPDLDAPRWRDTLKKSLSRDVQALPDLLQYLGDKPARIRVTAACFATVRNRPPSPLAAAMAFQFARAYAPEDVRRELEQFRAWSEANIRQQDRQHGMDRDLILENIAVVQKGLRQQEPAYLFRQQTLRYPSVRLSRLLEEIYRAISGRLEMTIDYLPKRARQASRGKVRQDRVLPLSLVFRHPKAYLVAQRRDGAPGEKPLIREYSLNRITDVKLGTLAHPRPADYSLAARLEQRGIESDTDPATPRLIDVLTLRVYPDSYPGYEGSRIADDVLESLPACQSWDEDRRVGGDDGSFCIHLRGIRDTLELRQWLLARMPTVVVEEPQAMAAEIREAVRVFLGRVRA